MNSRYFETNWSNSSFEGTLTAFAYFAKHTYNSLVTLKLEYEIFFNAKAKHYIDYYIQHFNEVYNKFAEICFVEGFTQQNSGRKKWESAERFYLNCATKNNLKPDLIVQGQNTTGFNEKYATQLSLLAYEIFKLEDECMPIVKEIWQNEITNNISTFNPHDKFNLIVKVITPWTDGVVDELKREYLDKRIASSCSLITHKKAKFFAKTDSKLGYVYDIGCGYMGALNYDANLQEEIKGIKNLDNNQNTNGVYCLINNGKNKVFAKASRLAVPSYVINKFSNEINEVVVNEKLAKPIAVFYIENSKSNDYYNKAKALSLRTKLPLLLLNEYNKYMSIELSKQKVG